MERDTAEFKRREELEVLGYRQRETVDPTASSITFIDTFCLGKHVCSLCGILGRRL